MSRYIEDIFIEFYKMVITAAIPIQSQDFTACDSFFNVITDGSLLTENQQKYIIRVLDKYSLFAANNGLDYQELISSPIWKNPVRIIDKSKKVWIEEEKGHLWIQFKFPYQLKDEFEKEVESKKEGKAYSVWDHERRIRSLLLYNANLLSVNEFVTKHRFEIDETFMNALAQWEEVLAQQENIFLHSEIVDGKVILKNATETAEAYWQEHATGELVEDLMLAKSMGYLLSPAGHTAIETVASQNSLFWVKSNEQLFDLYKSVHGKMCIILDRASDSFDWLKKFVESADLNGIDRSEIKVCFRETKGGNISFNEWVKSNNLGGSVSEGKILIFQNKPPKWLFKDEHSVKILVTNNLYPPTSSLTREWLEHHYCSIYVGDIKPSQVRNKKIVQL